MRCGCVTWTVTRFCLIVPLVAAITATAEGQGSGNESLAEMGTANSGSDWPFLVTRTVSGDILWVMKSADEVLIVVQDNRGRRAVFTVNKKTRFKADKNTEYAGKKHISADDLAVGQRVTIVFTANAGDVLALRFIAKAAPKKSGQLMRPSATSASGSRS